MSEAEPGGWRLDGAGYLRWRGTGYKAFRMDRDGVIWILDRWERDENGKRKSCERALTVEDLKHFCDAMTA